MKRMICYFLLCALVLCCIAGCLYSPPASTLVDGTTEPSGSVALENPTNGQTTQPTGQDNQPQQTEPGFTVPDYELEPLPTIDRETTGPLVEYDPGRELYILASQNDIIYPMSWSNNSYGFRIFSKKPLDVDSISVKVPISFPYSVSVSEREQGTIQDVDVNDPMNMRSYKSNAFTYPMYLAYRGKDFRKLAELKDQSEQLRLLTSDSDGMMLNGEITVEEYNMLMQPYWDAKQAYEDYLNAEWQDYLALTKEDLPQFYAYSVIISFDDFAEFVQDESFTQIEITIGDQVFVQDVGNVSLITDWELPAPIDLGELDGIIGGHYYMDPYNDGVICICDYFHFRADSYKLLEELVFLNPALKVERVWLQIKPASGKSFVAEWDMSEPYEIYPGDYVAVHVAVRDPAMDTPGYQNMVDGYLLYSADGEQYIKFSNCYIGYAGSDYFWNAVLFDGIDMEDYYWEYYYRFEEAWRFDPNENPAH